MNKTFMIFAVSVFALGTWVVVVVAQQPPRPRMHRIVNKGQLDPRPATSTPAIKNEVTITIEGDQRVITSNGIPEHPTGQFPNRGNPNRITPQTHVYRIPANPKVADQTTPMRGEFGVAINGVPFDPGAGEFYAGEPGWQYEPLSGAIDLGIDVSHAHVQPTGKYHYHGLPTGLIDSVQVGSGKHSPRIAWAADGFPIYAVYGYSDPNDANSSVQKLRSSYQLKQGQRPGGNAPGGTYDGTFVQDYEYVQGSGDLDECNGRFTVTPEYPEGTYAYFMTEEWPVVPRIFRGTPSVDFMHGPPRGGPGQDGAGQRGPRQRGAGQRGAEQRGAGHDDRRPLGRGGPPRVGQLLPDFIRHSLNLSAEQDRELDAIQSMVDDELKTILTPEQQDQLRSPRNFRARGGRPH
ncbi:hypothetical protein Pla52o_27950 [Novipirellula galeiformis]|uniref:YHYH domain-containing protein n=1 Tax=Novipirellula galeiformis TaxID=2528004 RepID=A0A5C6CKB0_9BACT|nr:YHYH protein [Novipirellula galeiformis]TWU23259.1 hypothetical protein Pla52o_27950 [Novipirellula galeiformis]